MRYFPISPLGCALAAMLLAMPALAQNGKGLFPDVELSLYAQGTVPVTFPRDAGLTAATPGAVAHFDQTFKEGFGGNAEFGVRVGDNAGPQVRVGPEVSYRYNTAGPARINKIQTGGGVATGLGNVDVDGAVHSAAAMLNLMVDFPASANTTLSIGGGAGGMKVWAKVDNFGGLHDNDWTYAYQGMAQVAYGLCDALGRTRLKNGRCDVELLFGYRYRGSGDVTLQGNLFKVHGPLSAHEIEGGVRINF